jgi:hypothetical protein
LNVKLANGGTSAGGKDTSENDSTNCPFLSTAATPQASVATLRTTVVDPLLVDTLPCMVLPPPRRLAFEWLDVLFVLIVVLLL